MKREREEKRPFVFLAKILNGLSEEKWEGYGLDKAVTAVHASNLQLPSMHMPGPSEGVGGIVSGDGPPVDGPSGVSLSNM